MGRGRVQLKLIENKISRQVTFSKRRSGLLKKAHEISVLCDAHVGLIIFSTRGRLFEYSSDSSMETILERYERYSFNERQLVPTDSKSQERNISSIDLPKLTNRMEVLQRNLRNSMGEDLDHLNLRELQNLEQQLDSGLKRIRARKNQLMHEAILGMQKKAKALEEENNLMTKKLKENEKLLAERTNWEQQTNNRTGLNSSTTSLVIALPPRPPLFSQLAQVVRSLRECVRMLTKHRIMGISFLRHNKWEWDSSSKRSRRRRQRKSNSAYHHQHTTMDA